MPVSSEHDIVGGGEREMCRLCWRTLSRLAASRHAGCPGARRADTTQSNQISIIY